MTKSRQHAPLLSRAEFAVRVARNAAIATALIVVSLGIGVVGYHVTADLDWVDSFLNAAMILTGMGPIDLLQSDTAKLFASFYALFSGVAFLTIVAVMMGPLAHRFLHRFHLELADEDGDRD